MMNTWTAALGAIFSGAEGGPHGGLSALIGKHSRSKRRSNTHQRQEPLGGHPSDHAHVGSPWRPMHTQRRDWAAVASGTRRTGSRSLWEEGQHLRSNGMRWDNSAQMERPLRADQLVRMIAQVATGCREETLRWNAPRNEPISLQRPLSLGCAGSRSGGLGDHRLARPGADRIWGSDSPTMGRACRMFLRSGFI